MDALVSVIVPVHNVETYLVKCIDSIISQTYTNLEIVLVDDGSTDNCGKICDEYAQKDSRIRVVHKTNAGPGPARNSGMEIAQGEYISFVDADDYMPIDAIEVLCQRIVADKSDIAVGRHIDVYENGNTNDTFCRWMKDKVIASQEVLSCMGDNQRLAVVMWAKLYRRELFEGIWYPPIACSEDLWVFPEILDKCNKISVVDHLVYYYSQRSNSILHRPTDVRIMDDICAGLKFVRYLWDNDYQKSALWWFGVKIEKALMLQNKEKVDALFEAYFSRQELRKMINAIGIKASVKWCALHCSFVNVCLQTVKRFMKRG